MLSILPAEAESRGGTRMIRGVEHLDGKAGRVRILPPGEKKLQGDQIVPFQDLKEPAKRMERDFSKGWSSRTFP